MDFQQAALTICGIATSYILYKRYRTSPISDVPGPTNPSWIYGHQWWWQCEDGVAVEERLLEEYGGVVRWNATLGEERLWIADPKAVYHVLQGTSYMYQKPRYFMDLQGVVVGNGVGSIEGDAHKRQRRAILPAFGHVEVKALYPYFSRVSNSLVDKWRDIISNTESGQDAIIDVQSWLGRSTLDVIGAAAFDYDFGALEDTDNKLTKSYTNLIYAAFGSPSKGLMFILDSFKWAPAGSATWIFDRLNHPGMSNIRENRIYAHEVARKLIEEKRQELKNGTPGRDLLSSLVKASHSPRQDLRLSDEEIIPQVRTFMFAGHETTSKTLTFALWELAKNRHVQERLRREIIETLEKNRTRGDNDFSADDFDSMPYLLAFGKEVFRFYPIGTDIVRTPNKDDVLPLSKPIVGVSGKVYKELLVPAGTIVLVSTVGYNVNKDVWGPDACEFRPERWFEIKEKPESAAVGVYANLLTFSGGYRSCIGWRFAVFELHMFMVTLLRQFDFTLPEGGREVRRMRPPGGMAPGVVGEEHKGPQMCLKVTALRSE